MKLTTLLAAVSLLVMASACSSNTSTAAKPTPANTVPSNAVIANPGIYTGAAGGMVVAPAK